jgi:glutathione synthase/RimK-type ligase-like ATP-grasp enzyme
MNIYVWYSAATDVTGKKLVEALDAEGGTAKPTGTKPILCWGTKTKKDVDFGARKVYNNPNAIKVNRHKFKALQKMDAAGVRVAPYTTDATQVGAGDWTYPIIARTNYHQGGAGFWLCLNKVQLDRAVQEGAQYFQKFIDVKDEYRLHVVDGEIIHAVKKVPRTNLKEAFVNYWENHITNFAAKRDTNVDEATMTLVLERMARKMATSVDMITRSNTRGWKFSRVRPQHLSDDLKNQAKEAVAALNLDYGAVDCCLDADGTAYIIEVNTGPGLDGTSFDAWVTAFKAMLDDAPKAKAAKKTKAKKGIKAMKEELKKKAKVFNKMLELAQDEEQVEMLKTMWAKM